MQKIISNRIFWAINLAILPSFVTAQVNKYTNLSTGPGDGQINISTKWTSLTNIIAFAINFAIAISGAILIIMLLVGGIMYLSGAGNEDQTGKAKKIMIDAVIGLFIVMSVYAISSFLIAYFK